MENYIPSSPHFRIITTNSTTVFPSTHVTITAQCDNDERNWKIVGILQILCASLSFVGALSLICFCIGKKICTSSDVRPLFHLACADLLLAVFLILSSTFFQFRQPCVFFQALAEMFYLMTFLLTANYALNTYVKMKDRYHRKNNLIQLREQKWFGGVLSLGYCLSWLVPGIVMIPAYVVIFSEEKDPCTLCVSLFFRVSSNETSARSIGHTKGWNCYGAILFLSTLLFSLLAIIILYLLTYKVYQTLVCRQNEFTNRQRSGIIELQKRVTLYVFVFLFCWTPAFILAVFEIIRGSPVPAETHLFLYILQSVTAPSQGLLNSLFYGWTRRSFRSNRETSALMKQTYRVYGSNSKRKYPQVPVRNQTTSDGQIFLSDD